MEIIYQVYIKVQVSWWIMINGIGIYHERDLLF